MKIKKELVLEILEALESRSIDQEQQRLPHFTNFDEPEVSYHFRYLTEGGIIRVNGEANVHQDRADRRGVGLHITFAGHEYLERLRNNQKLK